MNRIFYLIIFTFTFFIARSQISILDSIINEQEAKRIAQYLASDSLKGRLTGSPESIVAAHFIADEFYKAEVKPISEYPDYFMPFSFLKKDSGYRTAYNVLGGLQGSSKSNEIVIFSAHYDHVGTRATIPTFLQDDAKKNRSDSIYNGANDNASGVAALILLSKYFAALNNNERIIIFIAFSGEELGLIGSKALADQLSPNQTVAVINIEMLGRVSQVDGHPFITGDELSNIRSLLNKGLEEKDIKRFRKNFFRNDPYVSQNLFRRSDNISFANRGIPAHTIMLTSGDDKYYHSVKDEIETLDFGAMTKVIRAIALSSELIE